MIKVSVIIPTYHDWKRLSYCIDALSKQTYPQDKFEVIIVNNDPEDSPPELSLPDNFRIISEGKSGSYAARNSGIKEAESEILAFTDSDCIPGKYWIENAVKHMNKGAERVAGKIELFYDKENLTFAEKYEKAFAFRQDSNASKGYSVTANFITWRYFFSEIGLFNESMFSGGDVEWNLRAKENNVSIIYAENVAVKHPARKTIKEILNKRKRVTSGLVKLKQNLGLKSLLLWLIKGIMPPLFAWNNIKKRSDLTLNEKICAITVLHIAKIYGTFIKISYLIGTDNKIKA